MIKKKKVLIFIDWFYPAFKAGGPIKSVMNIIKTLANEIDFNVITSNRDADGTILSISTNKWLQNESYSICYLDSELGILEFLKNENLEYDAVYFNSIFSFKFTILPLYYLKKSKIKKIVAPRGMLGKGALGIKPIKKKIFLGVSKALLFRGITWHTSTLKESQEVKEVFGKKANTYVAQNISTPAVKRTISKEFKIPKELKLIFISRISTKKNLYFLLELLKLMEDLSGLTLDIYGPIEDQEYWTKCYALVEKDKRVQYKGVITPIEINSVLGNYHFFVLPTLHENYGHSIVEALNCGLPVMLSQQTPWRNLKAENIGFDISLSNKSAWMEALRAAYFMGGAEYETMTEACYQYATTHFLSENIIAQNKKLFLNE
jgi:glycosyltransferase involved in cell wall biosynthesis